MRKPAFLAVGLRAGLQRQVVQGIEKAGEEPAGVAGLALARAMTHYPSDDPRYAATFEEQIAEVQDTKLDDAAAFYKTYWGADHADMAIVGDFDPAQVKAAVTRLFGDWKSGVPYARIPTPPSDVAGQHLVEPLKDKANAVVIGQLPLKLQDTDADYEALTAATHILGGGEFGSRLTARIRQKDGLSYTVGSGLLGLGVRRPSRLDGVLRDLRAAEPREGAGRLRRGARALRQGRHHGRRARHRQEGDARAARDDAHERRSAVAGGWALKLDQGRTFAWSAEQDALLAALTVDQVNAAIRKWIVPGNVDWSTSGSFPAAK